MASDDSEFCHLCGSRDDLSFEHIPPRRCFNDAPTALIEMEGLTIASQYDLPVPPIRRYNSGLGRRSLCSPCNSFTGDKYGAAFFEWTVQAARYAEKVGRDNLVSLRFEIEPLAVLKQLATMAVAAADPSPAPFHRALRRFIRVPFERFAPPELGFYAYLNPSHPQFRAYGNSDRRPLLPLTRMTKTCAAVDITGKPALHLFAEIAFPPMGYVICFREPGEPLPVQLEPMADIWHFGGYAWGKRAEVYLRLPVRSPVGPVAGHYQQTAS